MKRTSEKLYGINIPEGIVIIKTREELNFWTKVYIV